MTPEVKAIFFLIALVLFVADAFNVRTSVKLTPLGLASFTIPFFWDAADAGWFD